MVLLLLLLLFLLLPLHYSDGVTTAPAVPPSDTSGPHLTAAQQEARRRHSRPLAVSTTPFNKLLPNKNFYDLAICCLFSSFFLSAGIITFPDHSAPL